jgi:hypothetical protein
VFRDPSCDAFLNALEIRIGPAKFGVDQATQAFGAQSDRLKASIGSSEQRTAARAQGYSRWLRELRQRMVSTGRAMWMRCLWAWLFTHRFFSASSSAV